jgi:hypothetical protein
MRGTYIKWSKYLAANPGASITPGAADGDGEKRLEIAIRFRFHFATYNCVITA